MRINHNNRVKLVHELDPGENELYISGVFLIDKCSGYIGLSKELQRCLVNKT